MLPANLLPPGLPLVTASADHETCRSQTPTLRNLHPQSTEHNLDLEPKIRDTIFVHANSSGWKGDLQPFLCLGAGAAGALCLATTVSIASPGFLGRSGRGSTAHTIKLAPARARMPHS